jgi:hypothetical protein
LNLIKRPRKMTEFYSYLDTALPRVKPLERSVAGDVRRFFSAGGFNFLL